MTQHEKHVAQQIALLVEGMNLRGLAEELLRGQEQLVFLLDTYKLWAPDGTFTFPDGDIIDRSLWTTNDLSNRLAS